MLTVLAFYFHLLLSICNSWFAVLFPTLLLCFCLRSSFCKSPALRSVGSKDTCGGCVHSRAFVKFIKGKPTVWNCSFLNNCGDGETRRQKGDEGSGSWWQEKILTFSVHLWISESVIDGRFEGRFQKGEMFRGLNGIHTILSEKATKGWEQEKKWNSSSVVEQLLLPWNAKCSSLMDFSYQTTKQNLLDHHQLHPHNLIVAEDAQTNHVSCGSARPTWNGLKEINWILFQTAKIYIGLTKRWGSSERTHVSELQTLKVSVI